MSEPRPDPDLPLEYQQAAENMARNHEIFERRARVRTNLWLALVVLVALALRFGLGLRFSTWALLAAAAVALIGAFLARLHAWSPSWWAAWFKRDG